MSATKRTRVLHVIGAMEMGGIETWLMHVVRNIDRSRFRFDFLVHTNRPATYDSELQNLGCRIIPCQWPRSPLSYRRRLSRAIQEHGPYDVVHSHVHYFSGWTLSVARSSGVPTRIAHSHTTGVRAHSFPRRAYQWWMRRAIWNAATHGIGISLPATESLFGQHWRSDKRFQVILYGFDFSPFRALPEKAAARRLLGIPADRIVVGHVGRFAEVKNHRFLVETFGAIKRSRPSVHLLLVGDGPLLPKVRQQLAENDLESHCTLAGQRSEVAPLLAAMDLFVFPSFYEGFGIAVLEAQAAGLKLLVSDRLPAEVDIVPEMVQRRSLALGAETWAAAALELLSQPGLSRQRAVSIVETSPLGIARCLRDLEKIYLTNSHSAN